MVLREVLLSTSQRQSNGRNHHPRNMSTSNSAQDHNNHEANHASSNPSLLPVPHPVPSYWLCQPHKYATLRSTPSLPATCDIAVIGSGMAGILTAYHILQKASSSTKNGGTSPLPKIVILEARDLCSGATARNGGHAKVKTATLAGLPDAAARNAFQAYVLSVIVALKKIVDEESLECEFELRRSFDVFCSASEGSIIKQFYEEAVQEGEAWTKTTSLVPREYVKQVTSIANAEVAFSVPCASFWPYKFCTQLLERLITRFSESINVQTNTPVTSLTESNTITTPRGMLHAGKIILATNAYTSALIPSFNDVIVPYKGMNSHHVPTRPIHPHLNHTYNIHFAPTATGDDRGVDYLNPRPDGSIVVGGGNWTYKADVKSWYNTVDDAHRFSSEVEKYWRDYMAERFLGWEDSGAQTDVVWVGIQGLTPDGAPHVGRVPERKGQWVLAGFNGGGMALIGVASEAVAEMVLGEKGFEDVNGRYRIPVGFATSKERLKRKAGDSILRRVKEKR